MRGHGKTDNLKISEWYYIYSKNISLWNSESFSGKNMKLWTQESQVQNSSHSKLCDFWQVT